MSKIFDYQNFQRALRFIYPYYWGVIFAIVSSIFLSVFSAGRPILIQLAFDKYISPPLSEIDSFTKFFIDHLSISFSFFMFFIVLCLLLESLLQFVFIYKSNHIAQLIIKDFRYTLFDKILKFKISYFDKTPIGKMITRVISDIEAIGSMFSQGVLSIFGDIFKIIIIIVWMFFSNWKLALLGLSFFPVLIFFTAIFQKLMKTTFEKIRSSISKLNVFVYEHITGMHIVKMFNREKNESLKFKKINKKYTEFNIDSILYFSIFLPIIDIFSAISMGLIVWFGGTMMLNDLTSLESNFNTSIGQLISFILLINMLFRPLRSMADKFNTLQMGAVASSRVFKLINDSSQVEIYKGKKQKNIYFKDIIFKNVFFSYKKNEMVLNNINLKIESGKTLAIVGPTGSGKTTLINLLNKFYKPNKGDVLIGDINVLDLDINVLRKNIGLILQDTFLFSDSIYNNITFFKKLNKKDVNAVLREMKLFDFVNSFPGGLDYQIGEGGGFLSMGQKQLISFIRTYISFSPILIFDEATSSLDSETESLIKKSIKILIKNKTSIIIAHRLSTIKNADTIVFLKDGKIVEKGNHQELINIKGFYWKYYKTQLV